MKLIRFETSANVRDRATDAKQAVDACPSAGASRRRMMLLAAVGINLGCAMASQASTLSWAAGPAALGGSGSWNLTTPLWTTNGTSFVDWNNGSAAVFGGIAGTVNASGAVTTTGLTFNSAYTLTGSGGLTLSGSPVTVINTGGFNVTDSLAANTVSLAGGTTTINKVGLGMLTLANDQSSSIAANTTWNISGGTLNPLTGLYSSGLGISAGHDLGNPAGSVAILNGGMIGFTASDPSGYTSARAIQVTANGGAISDGGFDPGMATSGGSTISPSISIASGNGLNLVANGVLELDAGNGGSGAGVISGPGGVTVYGTGVAEILSNGNTYTGGTTVNAHGTLVIGGASSLGSGNLSVSGTLNLSGASLSVQALSGNNGTYNFTLGSNGTFNKISATSASLTGNTLIGLGAVNSGPVSGAATAQFPGTFTVVSSASGTGLSGPASFYVAGGKDLTIPVNAIIRTINGTAYRLTLAETGSAINVVAAPAPRTLSYMSLGASTAEGLSYAAPYDGGGYRSQLYQHLVNDGRFNPQFVGSQTANGANNATGPDLMTTVGQPNHEGHPGYTDAQVLANLNGNDWSTGNNGGYWLAPGNGVNPDYIGINIGQNDWATGIQGANGSLPIGRLDQILTQIAALRPNATVVVSTLLYRTDGPTVGGLANGPTGYEAMYNALIPALVYKHVLAGQHVSVVDTYTAVTPNNSTALIGPDGIHPTQAGYDVMADAWYNEITTGQAFYTGSAGNVWNATGPGATTSWAMNFQRTTDAGVAPSSGTDVYFNGIGGVTALGADTSVRSVNFTGAAVVPVTIAGTNTLTIGTGGITVQAGTASHVISVPVNLGTSQTWSNVSTNPFTVSGNIGGAGALTIGGSGVIVLSGNNTFTGQINVSSGILDVSSTNALAGTNLNVLGGSVVFDQAVTSNAFTLGGLVGSGPLVLANNANAPVAVSVGADNASTTFGGQISGPGSLIKVGTGTLTLTNSNFNYSGSLVIQGGAVSMASLSGLGGNGGGNGGSSYTLNLNGAEFDYTGPTTSQTSSINLQLGGGNGSIGIMNAATVWNVTSPVTGPGMLIKSGAGTLTLSSSASSYTGGTTINAGLVVASGGLGALGSGSVTINGGGLILSSTSSGAVFSMLQSGYNGANGGGTWTGAGINSTTAATDPTYLHALGMLQPAAATTFGGQPLGTGDVAVKLTYYGDLNLDGQIDGSDYSLIDYAFMYNQQNSGSPMTGWQNGDLNYDGLVNGSDYTLMDNAFNQQGALIGGGVNPSAGIAAQINSTSNSTSAVPEPASAALLAIAAVGLLGRRQRAGR